MPTIVEPLFKNAGDLSPATVEVTPDELLRGWRRILILGPPGSGKSTALNLLAQRAARWQRADRPLLTSARRLASSAGSAFIDGIGESSPVAFLIDGLDEIPPADLRTVVEIISELSSRFPQTPIVVTARHSAGVQELTGFASFEILPWNERQIHQYLTGAVEDSAAFEALWRSARFAPLLRNPLFVSLLSQFSGRMALSGPLIDPIGILNMGIDHLLADVAASGGPSPAVLSAALENVAVHLTETDTTSFNVQVLQDAGAALDTEIHRNIEATTIQTGWIVRSESQVLQFSHRFYQELFLSRYLRRAVGVEGTILTLQPEQDAFGAVRLPGNRVRETAALLDSFGLPHGARLIPMYGRTGSLLIALLIVGSPLLAITLKGFLEGYGGRLGERAANATLPTKPPPMPPELLEHLPAPIRGSPEAQRVYIQEFARSYGQRRGERAADRDIAEAHVRAVAAALFGVEATDVDVAGLLRDMGIPPRLP